MLETLHPDANLLRALFIATVLSFLAIAIARSLRLSADVNALRSDLFEYRPSGRPPTRPMAIARKLEVAREFERRGKVLLALSIAQFTLAALVVPSLALAVVIDRFDWLTLGSHALVSFDGCSVPVPITKPTAMHIVGFLVNQAPEQFRITHLPILSNLISAEYRNVTFNPASTVMATITLAYKVWVIAFVLDGLARFLPRLFWAFLSRSSTVRELERQLRVLQDENVGK